ncbi:XVIPCD domain-containing protein [Xanthomonas sp. WHRI 6106]|uniref:XVIPCD domain-containing protein n=1 Tax=Xanthomonas sp. WHRI 6106 TaxID=3161566 RepID=UPI0032E8C0E0
MADRIVLGVHSWVDPNTQANGTAFDKFTDGHAWLTVSRNGEVSYYGLWPDSHPDIVRRGQSDPKATDIREGREAGSDATASRYYTLTPEQAKELEIALQQNVTWGPTTTCAGWASDTVTSVTGNRLDATEFLSIETPRELVKTIRQLEAEQPTAPDNALPAAGKEPGSLDSLKPQNLRERASAWYESIQKSAEEAVRRLEEGLGRKYDDNSERLAYGGAVLAANHNMQRVDHIVLNDATSSAARGEHFFVVQGDLNNPAHLRAHGSMHEVLNTPVEQHAARLREIGEAQVQQSQSATVEHERDHQQQRGMA